MRLVSPIRDSGSTDSLGAQLAGLDKLETPLLRRVPRLSRIVSAAWPKLAALAIALGIWQLLFLSGWKAPWLLPSPATVFGELWTEFGEGTLVAAVAVTLRRAAVGYAVAVLFLVPYCWAYTKWRLARARRHWRSRKPKVHRATVPSRASL